MLYNGYRKDLLLLLLLVGGENGKDLLLILLLMMRHVDEEDLRLIGNVGHLRVVHLGHECVTGGGGGGWTRRRLMIVPIVLEKKDEKGKVRGRTGIREGKGVCACEDVYVAVFLFSHRVMLGHGRWCMMMRLGYCTDWTSTSTTRATIGRR